MKRKNIYLFCLLVFMCIPSLWAQFRHSTNDTLMLYYRHFKVADGLSGNENYFVYEDSRKNIWVCSDNGVTRFDGTTFHNYGIKDGLCFNVIFGCKEDMYGNIWFYSYTGELSLYNVVTESFECPTFNDSLSDMLQGRVIKALEFDKDTMYLSAPGHSYKLFSDKNKNYTIQEIVIPGKTLMVHTGRNMIPMYNIKTSDKTIRLIVSGKTSDTINDIQLPGTVSNEFAGISCGSLYYYVFGENLLRYNFNTHKYNIMKLPFTITPCITKTKRGLLCGSYNEGIWSLVPSDDTMVCTRVFPNTGISSVIQNSYGEMWGSSHHEGVFYFPVTYAWWLPKKSIGDSENLQSILSSGDTIFYTMKGGGLSVLLKNKEQFYTKHLAKIPHNIVNIHKQKHGKKNELLLQSYSSMFSYDIHTQKLATRDESPAWVQNAVTAKILNVDYIPRLWIKYHDGNKVFEVLLPDRWQYGRLRTIVMTTNKKILLGNMFGLFVVDINTLGITKIGKGTGLNRLDVLDILPLNGDTAIAGTRHGVFAIVGDSIIKHIDIKDGLSGDVVYNIVKDGNNLYVATSKGIDVVHDLFSADRPVIRSITYHAGIYTGAVTYLGCINSLLIAGTDRGIFVIDRDKLLEDTASNSIKLTNITVNNNPVKIPLHKILELDHTTNSIGFHFTTFSSRNAFDNKFRYRLSNKDDNTWYYTTQSKIEFFSISPAQYIFELEVLNPNGTWNRNGIKFIINVLPPFWQKWWFLVLCCIIMCSGLYLVFRFRLREVKKIGVLKHKLLETRFQALGMQLNPHFVFNAMNLVSAYIANNEIKSTYRFLGKFAKLMRAVFNNSQHSIVPLEDELRALRLYLELEALRLQNKFEYNINVDDEVKTNECRIPSLILQPIVENAIWHGFVPSKEKGHLYVNIFKRQENLIVEIIDDGIGRKRSREIKRNIHKTRHSLEIIAERLRLYNEQSGHTALLNIDDRVQGNSDSGTKIVFTIPYYTNNILNDYYDIRYTGR